VVTGPLPGQSTSAEEGPCVGLKRRFHFVVVGRRSAGAESAEASHLRPRGKKSFRFFVSIFGDRADAL